MMVFLIQCYEFSRDKIKISIKLPIFLFLVPFIQTRIHYVRTQ